MSDNKIMEQASNAIINGLRATIDEQQKKIEDLQIKVKQYRETNDDLCFENDEINRKWAEDNERNGDIMAEQQEQIIRLEQQNKQLEEEIKDWRINFKEERQDNRKLKEQIPQKPGKKLSNRDKLVLSYLHGMLDVFNKEDKEKEEGDDMHGEWCNDETLALLARLIK